ncbi:hypothetical protein EDB81DRAFT_952137 [Dactylonectria macrodidyma]|uniref:DUF2306 domain-containing protein n=1 Tax=Dactylonectria macrodidyma TaxID=307937 RepID=A0A9P9DLA7_9HYPO|nr:hypothetical protein EDB81DRAFT_952137 [Dactylonectria macrodidyma]
MGSPFSRLAAFLRRAYRPVGFTKGYNFALWFVLGGALMGFSFARLKYLDFRGALCPDPRPPGSGGAVPGECYYFEHATGRAGIMMHLAGILPAAILVVFQFLPAIRHRFLIFHRINGYIVLSLSVASIVGVFMIAKPTFGGTLDMQVATGTASLAFLGCQGLGYYYIKKLQIEQHRAWMLRGWVIVGFIITMRIIAIIMARVTSTTGSYHTVGSCAVVDYIYSHNRTIVEALYPSCVAFYTGEIPDMRILIKGDIASDRPDQMSAGLNTSFGASAWLALAIHAIAVELYLRLTPAEAERLRRVSYQRQLEAGMKSTDSAERNAQRLGVVESCAFVDDDASVCRQATPKAGQN